MPAPATVLTGEQLALYPREILIEFPHPEGKDIRSFVQADNKRKYYLKGDRGDKPIRANEWLGYKLARICQIPTPACDLIKSPDNDVWFASEAIDGPLSEAETALFLEQTTHSELGTHAPTLRAALSAIHALDLFLNNVDRHYGNYLIKRHENGHALLALDFARSFMWRWPWDGFGHQGDTTAESWLALRQRHGFDLEAAMTVVARIGSVSHAELKGILAQMPPHWLSDSSRNEIDRYCVDGGWGARVAALAKGLQDGSIV